MTIITDEEFGEIVVKKRSLAKTVSFKNCARRANTNYNAAICAAVGCKGID